MFNDTTKFWRLPYTLFEVPFNAESANGAEQLRRSTEFKADAGQRFGKKIFVPMYGRQWVRCKGRGGGRGWGLGSRWPWIVYLLETGQAIERGGERGEHISRKF